MEQIIKLNEFKARTAISILIGYQNYEEILQKLVVSIIHKNGRSKSKFNCLT